MERRTGESLSETVRWSSSHSAAATRSHTASANDGWEKQTVSTVITFNATRIDADRAYHIHKCNKSFA